MFYNNGEPQYYMGSADWMSRNLRSRIEVVFPVYDELLKKELAQILEFQMSDTRKALYFRADLSNERINSLQGQEPIAAQQATYEWVQRSASR